MAKPIEKVKVTALIAYKTKTHVEILCDVPGHGAANMRLPYTAYDETTRDYVQSSEAMERAVENLKGIGISFDNVEAEAPGTEFEAYFAENKVTLWEPKLFITFSPIHKLEARQLRALAREYEFDTLPLTEFEGNRFNFGISVPIDGEPKNFRISQFRLEYEDPDKDDRRISTKYATRDITSFREAISKREMVGEAKERAEAALAELTKKARAELIETYKKDLGIDIEKILKTDDSLSVRLSVESIAGSSSHFLVAVVDASTVKPIEDESDTQESGENHGE